MLKTNSLLHETLTDQTMHKNASIEGKRRLISKNRNIMSRREANFDQMRVAVIVKMIVKVRVTEQCNTTRKCVSFPFFLFSFLFSFFLSFFF